METIFCTYNKKNYKNSDLLDLILDEKNKALIAELIYSRIYNRFLKIFTYKTSDSLYNEYKSGFAIMVNCVVVIETLASFIKGNDKTIGNGDENYNFLFKKAKEYSNLLFKFEKKGFYSSIRNGLLHQAETYNSFKIRRIGDLYDEKNKAINANLFLKELIHFLDSYRDDLKNTETKWDSELWDNCRSKIRHIVYKN